MCSTSKWTSLPRVTVSPPPSLLWSRLRWLPMAWPPGCSVFFPLVWRGQTGESFSPACSVNLLSVTNVFGTPQHVQLQTTGANEHADWMGSELWRKQDMNRKGLIAMMEVATLRQKCKKKNGFSFQEPLSSPFACSLKESGKVSYNFYRIHLARDK